MRENAAAVAPLHNLPEFTVSELSAALRRTVEESYARVRVRGELSGFKRAASGHLYFCLKDADAVLDGVCWRGQALRLGLEPADGLEVVCTGKLTTYPGRSKYQLVVESMELAGEGALLKMLEERRKRLAAEGLFAPERKRPLPFLPEVIGVVTSPTGAVIRDILHRLNDRFPRRVLLWPVLVQGEGAAAQVAAAIEGFNRLPERGPVPRPDLLIVARGGGSLEDLMAFNEEIVVRAAAASTIPLIAAVGHETDTTLIDHAADLRAPTPTAAAEMAVPVRAELLAQLFDCARRLLDAIGRDNEARRLRLEAARRGLPDLDRHVEEARQRLDDRLERFAKALPQWVESRRNGLESLWSKLPHPRELIARAEYRLNYLAQGLRNGADSTVARRRLAYERAGGRLSSQPIKALHEAVALRLKGLGELLDSYSYERVLERGFVLVRDEAGEPVTSAAEAPPGKGLSLRFRDGERQVTVDGAEPRRRAAPRKEPAPPGPRQGRLL